MGKLEQQAATLTFLSTLYPDVPSLPLAVRSPSFPTARILQSRIVRHMGAVGWAT
jgi:hypothetical protein